jgi:hypothetical protein
MVRSTQAVRGSVVPEYEGAVLGDERRTRRLQAIARRLQDDPRTAFPSSLQSTAELEGFYRFVNSDAFEACDILEPHRQRTAERAAGAGTIVVVHDTTTLDFPGRSPRPGLGVTTEGKHGFLAHVSLAVSVSNSLTPLGVLGVDTFTRSGEKWRKTKKSRTKVETTPNVNPCDGGGQSSRSNMGDGACLKLFMSWMRRRISSNCCTKCTARQRGL